MNNHKVDFSVCRCEDLDLSPGIWKLRRHCLLPHKNKSL